MTDVQKEGVLDALSLVADARFSDARYSRLSGLSTFLIKRLGEREPGQLLSCLPDLQILVQRIFCPSSRAHGFEDKGFGGIEVSAVPTDVQVLIQRLCLA